MSQEPQTYAGQTFTATVYVNGSQQTNPVITIARPPYLLERYDFDKIITGDSFWLTLAQMFMGAAIGLFVNMLSKLVGSKIDSRIVFDTWEVYAFLIALVLMGLCYGINYLVPNEKRRVVERIKRHFDNS